MNYKRILLSAILVTGIVIYDNTLLTKVFAVGTWNGQDTIHIPMSWCAVNGSPAVSSPNVPNPPNPSDTTTDAILWRNHERPTDNIWLPQAGITLRSAINNVWTGFNFPQINDPDQPDATHTNRGIVGDVLDPSIDQTQMTNMINACRTAYSTNGHAGVGITIVNVNLMHDSNGLYNFAAGFGRHSTTGGVYTGDIVVIDNHYTFPGIADPSNPSVAAPLSGPANNPSFNRFALTDPFDQLVGHEVGHTVGLHNGFDSYTTNHRTDDSHKLMFCCPTMRDNNGDGFVDNIALDNPTPPTPSEVNTARTIALTIPHIEKDPPNQIIDGNNVETIMVDQSNGTNNIPSYIDLSAERIVLDTKENNIHFGQELKGIIPIDAKDLTYWTLVDTDNNAKTGANDSLLKNIGIPISNFSGAEILMKVTATGNNTNGSVWKYIKGDLIRLPDTAFKIDRIQMNGIVDYASPSRAFTKEFPMNNIVSVMLNNIYSQIELNKPFNVATASIDESILDNKNNTHTFSSNFILQPNSFPHCFAQSDATIGKNVTINVEGLKPHSNIHGLLGPIAVFHGVTNETGGASIQFPIPKDTTSGLHLVTIGIDDTALTADCEVNVKSTNYTNG